MRLRILMPFFLLSASCAATPPVAAPEAIAAAAAAAPVAADGTDNAEDGFRAWVARFAERARAEGVAASTLRQAFDEAQYLPDVIARDRSQAEFTRQVWEYLDTAVSSARIETGRARLAEHRDAVDVAASRYGVPPAILVSIWGMESNYGSHFGNIATIDALATLGFDGRRQAFAERELLAALDILEAGDISRDRMRGSWAGAMGHTQFLPSSFRAYAVDGDGDGRRDIWGSIADVMASTANYLDKAGWREGARWGTEVILPESFDYALATASTRRSSREWQSAGIRAADGGALPELASASVLTPAGAAGPAFLVGHNFRVILRYNNATSYALAVGLLADRIDGGGGLRATWPRDQPALSRDQNQELQRLLNARGFDVGTPDGIIGPNTRKGLRAFQSAIGMTPDGFPTMALLERLRSGSR